MMNPDQRSTAVAPHVFVRALADLRLRLQRIYGRAYPDLREIIHLVLDEEEAVASRMSAFPHLLLPDLVEAHLAKLNLMPPAEARALVVHGRRAIDLPLSQPAFA